MSVSDYTGTDAYINKDKWSYLKETTKIAQSPCPENNFMPYFQRLVGRIVDTNDREGFGFHAEVQLQDESPRLQVWDHRNKNSH